MLSERAPDPLTPPQKPKLSQLGGDLLYLATWRKALAIALPFLLVAGYFAVAIHFSIWASIPFLFALEFFTYGSVSHDLVHKNYGLSPTINRLLLSIIELLCLRSGHAYMKAHLHHHRRFPHDDDIEGQAAKLGMFQALLHGIAFQHRILFWALRIDRRYRVQLIVEGVLLYALFAVSVASVHLLPSLTVYAILIHVGGWIIPFMTSYLVHDPKGESELRQTRLFRGKLASLFFFDHLYHLEHHLYPQVPHQNWPKLARRLNPFFQENKVRPKRILF